MEAAVVRGDVEYVDSVSAPDLTFTHGDGWTTGGKPLLVDDRASFLKRVERTGLCETPRPLVICIPSNGAWSNLWAGPAVRERQMRKVNEEA